MKKVLLSVLVFVSVNFVFAQENNGPELWITFQYTPKMGMNQKFETALAEKTKLYNKPDNAVYTAVLMTGTEAENGKYERIMPRRSNQWFSETLGTAETKFWQNNVAKYIQSGEGPYVWQRIKDLSINFEEPNPTKYFRSLTRVLKNGNNENFWRYLERYTKVMRKVRPDIQWGVFILNSGGNTNTVRLLTAFNNPNERQGETKNGQAREVYDKMFGEGSWEDDFQKYNECLVEWSRPTYDFMFRPDLSTKP
jgi:hypothetical protein